MRFIIILCGICLTFPQLIESGSFKIEKITCKCFDKTFCEFTKCEMNVVQRGVKAFNMHCELHQKPLRDMKVHIELFRKSNGYRSFMLNSSVDYCFYMRNPTSYPLYNALHKTFIATTNINHSCPFDHDLMINNFVYGGNRVLDELPLPNGEYMLHTKTYSSKAWQTELKVFLLRTE